MGRDDLQHVHRRGDHAAHVGEGRHDHGVGLLGDVAELLLVLLGDALLHRLPAGRGDGLGHLADALGGGGGDGQDGLGLAVGLVDLPLAGSLGLLDDLLLLALGAVDGGVALALGGEHHRPRPKAPLPA